MAYSTVLIIPAALRDDANLLGAALGHGPNNYTVPIPPDAPPTHYGAHTSATDEFFAIIAAAQGGSLPALDWPAHGLTPARVGADMAALVVSAPGSPLDPEGTPYATPSEHFARATDKFSAA
jgi:hypothetical protein